MQNLQVIEIEGQRVLTTRQLAEAYRATTDAIKINFNANKQRYTPVSTISRLQEMI